MKSEPIRKAWASPSGLGCTAYWKLTPHCPPSPSKVWYASRSRGVVMISSEMPELLGMCDRIYVMNEGRIVGELARDEASQERIMAIILKTSGKAA